MISRKPGKIYRTHSKLLGEYIKTGWGGNPSEPKETQQFEMVGTMGNVFGNVFE